MRKPEEKLFLILLYKEKNSNYIRNNNDFSDEDRIKIRDGSVYFYHYLSYSEIRLNGQDRIDCKKNFCKLIGKYFYTCIVKSWSTNPLKKL